MSALAAIHAKRRHVHSLKEDDTWRDFVEKHTGQRSTRGLTPRQSKALLSALDDLGGGKEPRRRSKLSGPHAKKIQALWISCWNLGLIQSRDDASLNRFAVKQANVDHANWIRHQEDAVAVIEALKKMLERRGVDWSNPKGIAAYARKPGYKIAVAQWQIVKDETPFSDFSFGDYVTFLIAKAPADLTPEDWITIMNTLGEPVRVVLAEGGA